MCSTCKYKKQLHLFYTMDALKTSTDLTQVELTGKHATPAEKKKATQSVDVKITFCTHVGWEGLLVMVSMLIIAGLFGYVTYLYTSYFNNFRREFVWLFMVMGLLFVSVVLYYLIRWKHMANTFMEEERKTQEQETPEAATTFFERAKNRYNSCQIFGKYYLWQLYASEICESINQTVNIFTVYTCSLPMGATTGICIALSIDCFHTVSFMARENNSNRRDRQIIIDTSVDFLCTALPILLMWFAYNVPISVQDMIQIAFLPAFMMLMKLDTILEEIIRSRTAAATVKVQEEAATRASRRRKSLYRGLSHFEIAEQQEAAVPRVVHMGAAGCKFLFGLMFLIIAMVQLVVQHNTTCEPLLWDSCVVKTPFCGSVFRPTCNCVVLNVREHNWTALPKKIHKMNALKVMQINHGPLEVIPDGFDKKFSRVSRINFNYNKLKVVPNSLGKMKLHTLYMSDNDLNAIPDSVWGGEYLYDVKLDNNNILNIPTSISAAKSVGHILISNNSLVKLPVEIFHLNLVTLFVDGNRLEYIPIEVGLVTTLQYVRFNNNNNISSIPNEIGNLLALKDIDLRNNAIESLPDSFESLNRLEYVYLHDNPVCSNGWIENSASKEIRNIVTRNNAGCVPQCSMYCQDIIRGDDICDNECNSADCSYDGDDC